MVVLRFSTEGGKRHRWRWRCRRWR